MIPEFSAVLLAGGKSSRMGRDKAFIEIDGRPLWQRQLGILQELGPLEILIAGPPRAEWANLGCNILTDARADAGPLGGLVAALRACSTPLLLALAIDIPRVPSAYLRQLIARCENGRGIVPVSDRFQPLLAVYPTRALPLAEELLSAGRYSLQLFARSCLAAGFTSKQVITAGEAGFFLNANTPAELALMP